MEPSDPAVAQCRQLFAEPSQGGVSRTQVLAHPLRGVPGHGGPGVFAVEPFQAELIAGEHDGNARQAEGEYCAHFRAALDHDRCRPGGVVRVQGVHVVLSHTPAKSGGQILVGGQEIFRADPVWPCLGGAEEVHIRSVLGEPGPQGAGEVGVRHGTLPVFTGDIGGCVGRGLGQQGGVRVDLANPVRDEPGYFVIEVHGSEAPGHVADVDPPTVQAEWWLEPARHHRVFVGDEASAQSIRGPVELGQRRHAPPGLVAGMVGAEVVVAGFLRARICERLDEPLMRSARVVRGEVPQDLDPACVSRFHQLHQGLVPAQERVHRVERGCIVTVVGAGRKERSQVQDIDAQLPEVIELARDSRQVSPIELSSCLPARPDNRLIPGTSDGPIGNRVAICLLRAGEPVREHLVHGSSAEPLRRRGKRCRPEIGGVGHIAPEKPLGVEVPVAPPHRAGYRRARYRRARYRRAGGSAVVVRFCDFQQEAVLGHGIGYQHRRFPPFPAVGRAQSDGGVVARLAVLDGPDPDLRRRTPPLGDAYPEADGIAKGYGLRGGRGDEEAGAVVVRKRDGHVQPFTEPAVSPLTMYFCRNRNSAMTGMAAMTAPAAKIPQFSERCWAT
ncbi:hypothetical protein PJL18_01771 [Paenarthrobacter nicotinovorans]|nr:hypothetical protein [Paenarthrobacter nicotinovorans]